MAAMLLFVSLESATNHLPHSGAEILQSFSYPNGHVAGKRTGFSTC